MPEDKALFAFTNACDIEEKTSHFTRFFSTKSIFLMLSILLIYLDGFRYSELLSLSLMLAIEPEKVYGSKFKNKEKMMKKIILTVVVCLLSLLSTSAFSQRAYIRARIRSLLIHDKDFGKCMVKLDKTLDKATKIKTRNYLNCQSTGWVSFSCDGTYNSKDIAYRKLDMAKYHKRTGADMIVYVDDEKKHNGYCYAYRVEEINTNDYRPLYSDYSYSKVPSDVSK